jgi:protein TonB
MESKKNPKADITRNASLYFAIGLALMVFLSYTTINWKVYDKSAIDIGTVNMDELDDEEIPLLEQVVPPPPPPPPPAAPEVIEVVEDEEEVEETVIESTETDQEEEIEIEDLEVEEIEEDIEVPFAVIENVPIFPGCDKGNNAERRKCMSQKITKFVQRKFNTDLAGDLGLSGRQRINVIFKIDKNGDVVEVRARAPHPDLEKEAIRVINLLPKMKPGMQFGKAVTVPYSLPIIFQVQNVVYRIEQKKPGNSW